MPDVIEEHLRAAKAVVVIWSDEAVKSQWVRAEVNRGREQDDVEQEYFSDGISEEIVTDLSKVSALFVIARNMAFNYDFKAECETVAAGPPLPPANERWT